MNATITNNQIAVRPSENESGKWLTIDVPNGWDDVKRISKKVLEFNGENYTFMCWNSDTMLCHFKQTNLVAKIK
jgi:hypothetical protein